MTFQRDPTRLTTDEIGRVAVRRKVAWVSGAGVLGQGCENQASTTPLFRAERERGGGKECTDCLVIPRLTKSSAFPIAKRMNLLGEGGVRKRARGLQGAERTPLMSPSTCIPFDRLLSTLAKEGRGDLLRWEESTS